MITWFEKCSAVQILLPCLPSKDRFQVQSRVLLGCLYAIHNRFSDTFLKIMVKKLQTLLRDVRVGLERKNPTEQHLTATENGCQMFDV